MSIILKSLLAIIVLSACLFAADGYKMSINADKTKLCYDGKNIFLSGMNVAWFKFSQDCGRQGYDGVLLYVDESKVRKTFQDLRNAGGNSIRWWLYTNNAMDPIIDSTTDLTTGIETSTTENVQKVLDIAAEYGVVVDICFLSFDMLKDASYSPNVADHWSRYNYDANYKMLTDTSATRAFIDNAVLPLVKIFKDHPGLMCWEVFNEPEGMTSTDNFGNGWGTVLIDIKYIQRFINMVADAIHTEAPNNLVSNGSAKTTMTANVPSASCKNYYTDSLLLASGNNKYAKGILDFYMVHYYPEWNSNAQSPFHNPKSFWKLDKPLVIGEFPAASWTGDSINAHASSGEDRRMTVDSAYTYANKNGYAGALSWMMYGETSKFYQTTWCLDSVASSLKYLYNTYPDQIKFKDVTIEDNTGKNGRMQITYNNAGANSQLSYTKPLDLTDAKSVSVFVKNTGSKSIKYMFVFQTGSTDKWGWYQSSTFCTVAPSDSATYMFKLSDIAKWDDATARITSHLSEINAVYLVATTTFNGVVYIDNIATDNGIVINNFDKQYDVFSPTGSEAASISTTTSYSTTTLVSNPGFSKTQKISGTRIVNGSLKMIVPANGVIVIDLFNVNGKRMSTLYNGTIDAGTHTFTLNNLAKGMYLVRAYGSAGIITEHMIVK